MLPPALPRPIAYPVPAANPFQPILFLLNRLFLLPLGVAFVLMASAAAAQTPVAPLVPRPRTTTYPLRQRAPGDSTPFRHEAAYIRARRAAAAVAPHPVTGLALSGGGIRSATLNLGVLQALEVVRQARRVASTGASGPARPAHYYLGDVDYLSAVSGGAYVGSWLVSRLGARQPAGTPRPAAQRYDARGVLVATDRPADLLVQDSLTQSIGYAHLLTYSHFLASSRGGTLWGIPRTTGSFLLRIGPNILLNLLLPLRQLTQGWTNKALSANGAYQRAIQRTYLYGAEQRRPLCADYPLASEGRRRYCGLTRWDWAFRTSRAEKAAIRARRSSDRVRNGLLFQLPNVNPTGSVAPYLILNASAEMRFGKGPDSVRAPFEFTRDFCGSPITGYVSTYALAKPVSGLHYAPGAWRPDSVTVRNYRAQRLLPDLQVRQAASASGAGVSGADVGGYLASIVALDAQLATRNFARARAGRRVGSRLTYPVRRLWDVLAHRYRYRPESGVLSLADGGKVENTGLLALVQRRVARCYVVDAGGDAAYTYESLRQSRAIIGHQTCGQSGCAGLRWTFEDTTFQRMVEHLADPGFRRAHYPRRHQRLPPAYVLPGHVACACPGQPVMRVYYCKVALLDESASHVPLPEGVRRFRMAHAEFPQITTASQIWPWSRFEAYRQLGFYIGNELIYHLEREAP